MFSSNTGRTFVFDEIHAYELNLERHVSKEIHRETNEHARRGLLDLKCWNDTIVLVSIFELKVQTNEKVLFRKIFDIKGIYNRVEKLGDLLYLFSMYHDQIASFNLKTGKEKVFKAPSNQVIAESHEKGIFFFTTYKGFAFLDSVPHQFSPDLPAAESFAISHDTLWVLDASGITSYKVSFKDFVLTKISTRDIKALINNFLPQWIRVVNSSLYCGNSKGFFAIDGITLLPLKYFYLGNFSELAVPAVFSNKLFFKHSNYIAAISPPDLEFKGSSTTVKIEVSPNKSIYEYTPFFVDVHVNDYLKQRRSLKSLQFIRSGDTVVYFTTGDRFEINAGLGKGQYTMVTRVDGAEVDRRSLYIRIPLASNPLFYAISFLFLTLFVALWAYNVVNKRKYEKQILNNRMQLLKQNLNPHFIFNSLNLIYSLVLQNKKQLAINTINSFADLHRYYLGNISKLTIALSEEIAFIGTYLKLESARREVDAPFIYTLPEISNKSFVVPPMILQPLVENAVKYCGPENSSSAEGRIWISCIMEAGRPVIFIENTIASGVDKPKGTGLGISQVRERIDIYNKSYREKIVLAQNLPPIHASFGYRVGVWL